MFSQNLIIFNSIILCILFIQYPGDVMGFCPAKCSCNGEHNLRVSCINASLQEVPIQLNPEAKYINLTINQIANVHYTLQFYTQVEIIDLSRNQISTVGSKNFDALNQLKTLNLSQNLLEHLPKDAFNGLDKLKLLDLSKNKIARVHITAMVSLINVIDLDLSNNAILSIDDNVFKNLLAVERLLFNNNEMVDVPSENLMHLRNLKMLDLSGNLIEFIKNDSFVQLRKLITLQIRDNVINDIEVRAFDGLPSLRYLDLADNNLTIVPTSQLSILSNLTYLSLNGNRFTHIPPVALLNLFQLRELHLSHLDRLVRLDPRAFVDNTFLQIITLDQNPSCSTLPLKLFRGNPKLVEISIKGNNLHTLEAAQLPLDHLHKLSVADNPFVCNCSLQWLWRLTRSQAEGDDDGDGDAIDLKHSKHSKELNHSTDIIKNQSPPMSVHKSNQNHATSHNLLVLDINEITCNQWEDEQKFKRHLLKDMSASDIKCPASVVTIVCAVISVLIVLATGISVLYYVCHIRNRKSAMTERKNVNERIVPNQVDKTEFERYLAQEVENEYRALRQWEVSLKEQTDEPDHYEECNNFRYDTRRTQNPHVVYV